MELRDLLSLLSGVRKENGQYKAICPAHPDQVASLAIKADDKGIALHCHAGCETVQVLHELDLGWSDLFMDETNGSSDNVVGRTIIAEYDYVDEKGHLLYQVVRFDPKDFRQRQPNGSGWTWNMKGVRRVPYMLPEVISANTVFIVEGEKDVHTLRVHGFTATTNAGGAGKWDSEWNSFFAGKRVILIPDMDESGLDHANKVASYLRTECDLSFVRLWDAKDISEWFLYHKVEEFTTLVEQATSDEAPASLIEEPFDWPDFPLEYGLIGDVVSLVGPHSEADPIAIYLELLATFGNALGPGPHYKIGGTYHRCNLFLAVCGETASGRKGSAHDWVVEIFRIIDPYYVDNCMLGGLSSGEGVIHAVRDAKTKTGRDGQPIASDDGVSDKRRLFVETELAGRTFTAMKREGNTLSAVLRQAWESSNLAVATKSNDDHATGAHISIVGHATVKELFGVLRVSDIAGGFANRFLFVVVRRSKMLPIQTEPERRDIITLAARIRRALEDSRKVGRVTLAEGPASRLWEKLYTQLDQEAQDESLEMGPFLSRSAPQILRLAMILTLIDGQSEIGVPQLETAAGIWHYARSSVEFMMSHGLTGNLTTEEATLYAALEKLGRPVASSEVAKMLKWSGSRLASVKGKLLGRKIIYETKAKSTGGRPANMLSV